MKQWFILLTCIFTLFPGDIVAQSSWEIERFDSVIHIEADGFVTVQETIAVDFGSLEKHGIFRDIPIVYQGDLGKTVYTSISDIEVMQDEAAAKVDITKNSANMRIRIGDASKTISGEHTYVISYRVLGALQAFDGFDELNWNVTGNYWEAPIQQATATVTGPAPFLQATCYEGAFGATTHCQGIEHEDARVRTQSGPLAPGEGLTIAVGYVSGVVPVVVVDAPVSPTDILLSPITFGVSALTFFAGFVFTIRRWWVFGRDRYWQRAHLPGERSDREGKNIPEKVLPLFFKQPVSVEYDPPDGLRPAEIGVLMDEKADTLDVSATIIDLASRGYLTITEIPKKWLFGTVDYELRRTEKAANTLLEYEQELVTRLFTDGMQVNISDLKNTFYKDLAKVKDLLYEEVVRKGLFPAAPHKTRQIAVAKSIGIDVIGVLLVGIALWWLGQSGFLQAGQYLLAGGGIGLIGTGVISLLASSAMPRKTGYGREVYQRVRGYELFVSRTEKYRAKFFENEGLFIEVLPYAIMFGVTDKLARAFKEMGIKPPDPTWYHGVGAFNATQFASSMGSFSSSLSSAMASSPSSSGSGGGGSSGGGFGGGGGGSW